MSKYFGFIHSLFSALLVHSQNSKIDFRTPVSQSASTLCFIRVLYIGITLPFIRLCQKRTGYAVLTNSPNISEAYSIHFFYLFCSHYLTQSTQALQVNCNSALQSVIRVKGKRTQYIMYWVLMLLSRSGILIFINISLAN